MTFYYDPIIDEHLEVPAMAGAIPAIYLAPQVPDEARRLWDAARAQMGMLEVTGPLPVIGPRFTAMALLLARNWAVTDLADALQAARDEQYPPTWDHERGEMTWDFGLGEAAPARPVQRNDGRGRRDDRGRVVAARQRLDRRARFDEPTVCDVDFPTVALTRAEWDARRERLHLAHAADERRGRRASRRRCA